MLNRFEKENALDAKLGRMKSEHLAQLYLRVFNTDDGLLVLRDMENRSFIQTTTVTNQIEDSPIFNEGIRAFYLSIVSRMKEAVTKTGGK